MTCADAPHPPSAPRARAAALTVIACLFFATLFAYFVSFVLGGGRGEWWWWWGGSSHPITCHPITYKTKPALAPRPSPSTRYRPAGALVCVHPARFPHAAEAALRAQPPRQLCGPHAGGWDGGRWVHAGWVDGAAQRTRTAAPLHCFALRAWEPGPPINQPTLLPPVPCPCTLAPQKPPPQFRLRLLSVVFFCASSVCFVSAAGSGWRQRAERQREVGRAAGRGVWAGSRRSSPCSPEPSGRPASARCCPLPCPADVHWPAGVLQLRAVVAGLHARDTGGPRSWASWRACTGQAVRQAGTDGSAAAARTTAGGDGAARGRRPTCALPRPRRRATPVPARCSPSRRWPTPS